MPRISALTTCNHTTNGFSVKRTQCQAIGKGKCATWTGLTVKLARLRYPNAEEKVLGTMIQKSKNILSTKKQLTKDNKAKKPNLNTKFNKSEEVHFFIRHSRKFILIKRVNFYAPQEVVISIL